MPFTKGHKLATGRPQGSKNRVTLLKEERRAIFEQQVSQEWESTIRKLRPEYIADQFMGKAPEEVNVNATVKGNLTTEVLAIAEEELKKRKLNDQ